MPDDNTTPTEPQVQHRHSALGDPFGDGLKQQALQAYKRITRGFDDWLVIARFIEHARHFASERSGATRGPIYARILKKRMGEKFHAIYSKLSGSGVTTALSKILEELDDVQAWRNRLPEEERLKFNHPDTVWRAYQASLQSTIAIVEPSVEPAAFTEDEDDGERSNLGSRSSYRDDRIAELEDKILEMQMTQDPHLNADLIWQRYVEKFGWRQTRELYASTIEAMQKVLERDARRTAGEGERINAPISRPTLPQPEE